MIERLQIQGFRAIADSGELSLCPGINVFIGPNGAGKSSLVEALRFLHDAVSTDTTRAVARWRGFEGLFHRAAPWSESLVFHLTLRGPFSGEGAPAESARYRLLVGAEWNRIDATVEAESVFFAEHKDPEPPQLSANFGHGTVYADPKPGGTDGDQAAPPYELFTFARSDLALRAINNRQRYPRIINLREHIGSFRFVNPVPALMRPPTPLSLGADWNETGATVALQLARATKEEIAEVSRRLAALLPGTERLSARVSGEGALLEVREQVQRGLFPSWTLSDGTLRLLAILTALHVGAPPAVLCLEEPENSLHPALIAALLEECAGAAERGTQVIMTTHSPFLLNHLDLSQSRAFFVSRREGAARFQPLPGGPRIREELERFGLGELLEQGVLGDAS